MTRLLDVHFHNMQPHESVTALIQTRLTKLQELYPHITRCHVAIDVPHRHHRKGRRYAVQIDLTVPGKELVSHNHLEHTSAEHLTTALSEAFRVSERQLKAYSRVHRPRTPTWKSQSA